MKNDVKELQRYFCPFEYLDLQAICEIWDCIGLWERELFKIIEDYSEQLWYQGFDDIDPVYIVFEYVLQQVRHHIEKLTWYDFINDFSWNGTEIYTCWEYMATCYDYSEEAVAELTSKISNHMDILMNDDWCNYFLNEIGAI